MATLAERAEQELGAVLANFAAGEAEVVRTYFARPRTTEEHFALLQRQMGRELFCADWLERAVRWTAELERSIDRHEYVDFLEQIADEVSHYVALADLAEWLVGRKLTPEECSAYKVYAHFAPDLPLERQYNPRATEANAMLDLLRQFRAEHPPALSDAVMRLTEGGGGGAFLAGSEQGGDPFRERFAAAMGKIVADELGHGPLRLRGFVQEFIHDEADLTRALTILRAFMAQHVRVRNEIYGQPLSADRLAAIDRGEIAPLTVPQPAAIA